jgi:hypothetical protein
MSSYLPICRQISSFKLQATADPRIPSGIVPVLCQHLVSNKDTKVPEGRGEGGKKSSQVLKKTD